MSDNSYFPVPVSQLLNDMQKECLQYVEDAELAQVYVRGLKSRINMEFGEAEVIDTEKVFKLYLCLAKDAFTTRHHEGEASAVFNQFDILKDALREIAVRYGILVGNFSAIDSFVSKEKPDTRVHIPWHEKMADLSGVKNTRS